MPTEDVYSSGHLVLSHLELENVVLLRLVSPKFVITDDVFLDFEFRIFINTFIIL